MCPSRPIQLDPVSFIGMGCLHARRADSAPLQLLPRPEVLVISSALMGCLLTMTDAVHPSNLRQVA